MSTLSVPAVSELRAEPAPQEEELRARDTGWYPQARALVSDLYARSPLIYWTDFLLSIGGAWTLTAVYFMAPTWSAIQIASFLGASVLFFRAGTFIHELVHMPMNMAQWRWFGRVWNLLMGIPLLAPWILYRNHVDHHSAKYFGTPDDGEYLPLASSPVTETLKYLAQTPLLPLFQIARFGILAPLSWMHRGLREWVLTATSAAVSNPYYRKRFPQREQTHLLIVEVLCFVYILAIVGLVVKGVITGHHLLLMYLLFAWSLSLNWIRNLAAHRYGNRGDRMTHLDQFSDSINITGQTWLTVLMFPVGLRYHALHHLFPSLPYHNLGKAHRRLSEQLPPDSPYHATGRNSFFAAAADLWRAAARTTREQSAMPRWLRRTPAN
jgi:fatty acid desaturase